MSPITHTHTHTHTLTLTHSPRPLRGPCQQTAAHNRIIRRDPRFGTSENRHVLPGAGSAEPRALSFPGVRGLRDRAGQTCRPRAGVAVGYLFLGGRAWARVWGGGWGTGEGLGGHTIHTDAGVCLLGMQRSIAGSGAWRSDRTSPLLLLLPPDLAQITVFCFRAFARERQRRKNVQIAEKLHHC